MTVQIEILGGRTFVEGSGKVLPGDNERLLAAMALVKNHGGRVDALGFNSPGGSVTAAIDVSQMVRASRLPVYIFSHDKCASACVLFLAAGVELHIGRQAAIGVHRGGFKGSEDANTAYVNAELAKLLAAYGMPQRIIDKAMSTSASGITWLKADDFADLHPVIMP